MPSKRSILAYPNKPIRNGIIHQWYWQTLLLILVFGLLVIGCVRLLADTDTKATKAENAPASRSSDMGYLQVKANTPVASVIINGEHVGQVGIETPFIRKLAPGNKEVTVSNNVTSQTQRVLIKADEWSELSFPLGPEKRGLSRLVVQSNIHGARISINGQPYGTTWAAFGTSPGTYKIQVAKDGFENFEKVVYLEAGQVQTINVNLNRLASSKKFDCPNSNLSFQEWLQTFKNLAVTENISHGTTKVLDGVKLNHKVLTNDRYQSEYTKPFFQYLSNQISNQRIEHGKRLIKQYEQDLDRIEKKYDVPREIIVALWGMETDYGKNIGDFLVIQSLATLAYQGRRSEFFCSQLRDALRIIDTGKATEKQMVGSWAGAMGQPQFMPSTFLEYAKDGDEDGRIDIWKNPLDVFESAANYLSSIGWKRGERWGREVLLPPNFDFYEARLSNIKPLDYWRKLKISQINGQQLPQADMAGAIILPAGRHGPAFLVYENFHKIMEWNYSLNYALTVAHLADRLIGGEPLNGKPPADDRSLRRDQIIAMQEDLNRLGYDAGEPDGMVGKQSRAAIREFQHEHGIPADAYPTPSLIADIKRKARHASSSNLTLSDSEIRKLQTDLEILGFYKGAIDGIIGKKTHEAITAYRRHHNITGTNNLTAELMNDIAEKASGHVRKTKP